MIATVLAVVALLIAVGILLGLITANWLAVAVVLLALAILLPAINLRGT